MYQDILTKTGLFGKSGQNLKKPSSETLQLFFIGAILLLVAVAAFGLGRLSGLAEGKGNIKIYSPIDVVETTSQLATPVAAPGKAFSGTGSASQADPAHNFVASKNGAKYYAPGCSGASRIKAANEVWFATAQDAQAAGYTLASGCK